MAQAVLRQAGGIGTALAASRSVNTVITPLATTIPQARESTLPSMGRRLSAHHSSQNRKGRWQNVSGGKDEDAKIAFASSARRKASLARKAAANDRPLR